MSNRPIIALCCLAAWFPQAVLGSGDPLLESALAKLNPSNIIEVTLLNGDRYWGNFAGVQGGELVLAPAPETGLPTSQQSWPLQEIVRLRVERSGARRGFSTGFATGAVAVGSLSLLWGLAISTLNESDDDTMGIIGFTALGTLAGGLGLGVIGAGIGALTDVWYTLYESPLAPTEILPVHPDETRLGLGIGVASGFNAGEDFQETGLYSQLGLQKTLGSSFEFGPEIAYYDLGGTVTHGTGDTSYFMSVSPVLTIGLAGSFQSNRNGWVPYFVTGTGYYIDGGEYLGLSFGGGLRHRGSGRQDVKLEIRDHVNLYDDGHSFHYDHFLTLGANISFSL